MFKNFQMKYCFVYFDGSTETAGHVMYLCTKQYNRVWIVLPRSNPSNIFRLKQICNRFRDNYGSLGHFENKKYIQHYNVGSPRHIKPLNINGDEFFFQFISNLNISEESKIEYIQLFDICFNTYIQEQYGFYNIYD